MRIGEHPSEPESLEAEATSDPVPSIDEPLFLAARAEIKNPERTDRSPLLAIGLFVAFLIASSRNNSWFDLIALVAVLLFHEAGHLLAMRLFGYRDLKVFFIPFFGAVATGKRDVQSPWQHALVLLAGPIPGLVLALGLSLAGVAKDPALHGALWLLVSINLFNLLPLEPLDGGRLISSVVFSQQPSAEYWFAGVTSLAMGCLAYMLRAPFLGAIAAFGLVFAPGRFQLATLAAAFRSSHPSLPRRLEDADDALLRQLFAAASPLASRAATSPNAHKHYARHIQALHERASALAPSRAAMLALLAAYFSGGLIGVAAMFSVALAR